LQRQVSFKSQLYSELQKQVAQSRLDLQRSEPVITVVEEPVPPLEKSGPNTILIIILLPLVGAILTTAVCLTYDYVAVEHLSDEQQAMVEKRLLGSFRLGFARGSNRVGTNWVMLNPSDHALALCPIR
jgi:hypothetical protein